MEKYTKVRVLGKGSFGSAILIKRRSDSALLVIKEVFLGKMGKREREEARKECRMLQQLNHPNIVHYVEHFENKNNLYIVMEYCDGGDLHGKLKSGPLKESSILCYYSQVCLAMEYLHSRHILHRDIKTMNVFLMKNGSVKLGDFGISTVLRNTMGMANTVCGTPYYFSPEICLNKPYNNKSDVWALGVLLYELATGRHPFDGTSMQQLMQRIVKGKFSALPTHFSPEFRRLVEWCLKKDPAQRPSIKQMLSLSVVRGSLEQLEENLMLATQCKVRLKDIMDFDARSDVSRKKNEKIETPTKQGQQQLQEVVLSAKPPAMSPGKVAAMAVAGEQGLLSPRQRLPTSEVPLDPKPKAAGAVVDHNRIENFRRYLQQQYQRVSEGEKALPNPSPAPKSDDNSGGVALLPIPRPVPAVASPKKRPSQQQEPRVISSSPDDRRNMKKELHKEDAVAGARGKGAGGDFIGFEQRMERIDAIMKRYAQNVDPKARDTIHAYMKRKREDYIQQQKMQQDRIKQLEEARQKELAMIIKEQNRICRSENIYKSKQLQPQQQMKGARQKHPPSFQLGPHVQSPSPIKTPLVPQQQRQQQHCGFGRDPRYGRRASRENGRSSSPPTPPPSSLQKDEHACKRHNVPNIRQVSPTAKKKKKKILAANSPNVLEYLKLPQPSEPSHGINGNRGHCEVPVTAGGPEPTEASPKALGQKVRDTESNNSNNRKLAPPPSITGQERPSPRLKGDQDIDALLPQQQPKAVKASRPLQQVGSPQKSRVANMPIVSTAVAGIGGNVEDGECQNEKGGQEVLIPSKNFPSDYIRRNSAPLLPPVDDTEVPSSTPLVTGLQLFRGKRMIRPTAAAGFVPQAVGNNAGRQQKQAPLRVQSLAASMLGPKTKTPPPFPSKDEIPASVKTRRQVEQKMQKPLVISDMISSSHQRPTRRGTAPQLTLLYNKGEPKSTKEIARSNSKSSPNLEIGKTPVALNAETPAGMDNKTADDRRQRLDVPQPLSLIPLQPRLTQMPVPQSGFASSPINSGVVGSHVPFVRQGKQPQRNGVSMQPGLGIMPSVLGVKVPPQARGQPLTGARFESNAVQNVPSSHSPILVNVDYGVSMVPPDDGAKQVMPTEPGQTRQLPSISDACCAGDPPDILQKWHNIVEHNGAHKMIYRPQTHMPIFSVHDTLERNENDDLISAFQKVKGAFSYIPNTLETLSIVQDGNRETDTPLNKKTPSSLSTLTKGEQDPNVKQPSSPPKMSSLLSGLPVPLCLERFSSRQPLSPMMVECPVSGTNSSSNVSRSANTDDVGGRGELQSFVNGFFEARESDEREKSNASVFSSDLQVGGSLNGYIEMLDHLREVLHCRCRTAQSTNRKKVQQDPILSVPSKKEANIQFRRLSPTRNGIILDLLTPKNLSKTKPATNEDIDSGIQSSRSLTDSGKRTKEKEQETKQYPEILGSEYKVDEEDYDDSAEEENDYDFDDDDFEDALPLSPVRCATVNDQFRCLVNCSNNVSSIKLALPHHNNDEFGNSNAKNNDVDASNNASEEISRGCSNGFIANGSFFTASNSNVEAVMEGGYGVMSAR